MKASLQLRLGQQLAMTPQLQQAIRLLQLSSLDLQQEIRNALETNCMLEEPENAGETRQTAENSTDGEPGSSENQIETDWDSSTADSTTSWSGSENMGPGIQAVTGNILTLHEHLLYQLELSHLLETDRAIAAALIDSIDDDGYLKEDIAEISRSLDVDIEETEAVLHLIQRLDPVGAGARDLSECLLVQLQQFVADTPGIATATKIVAKHLELLASHKTEKLGKLLGVDDDELRQAMHLVRSLNPKPGLQVSGEAPQYIVPDVLVTKHDNRWRVELNQDVLPRIRVNSEYARLVSSNGASAPMKEQLQQARWLMRSLEIRNETLLKVATAIVQRQAEFLEHGEEHMKPMILKDVAEAIEMHESTVSRITSQKYMHTPRGIFEFKYFFSSHISTRDGEEKSSVAIRAMIKKLISDENPAKPLSDSRIAKTLVERGIKVARRTVTKYREAMAIPASHERKNLELR